MSVDGTCHGVWVWQLEQEVKNSSARWRDLTSTTLGEVPWLCGQGQLHQWYVVLSSCFFWYRVMRREHCLSGIFPQTHNLTLIMRKQHTDLNWGTFNKIPDQQYSSKVPRLCKTRKARCYELQVCVPSKFTCWNPHPQCDGIRRWCRGEVTRSWG